MERNTHRDQDFDALHYELVFNAAEAYLAKVEDSPGPLPPEKLHKALHYLNQLIPAPEGWPLCHTLLNALGPHLEQSGYRREKWIKTLEKLRELATIQADSEAQLDIDFHQGTLYIRMSRYQEGAACFERIRAVASLTSLRYAQATIRLVVCLRDATIAERFGLLYKAFDHVQDDRAERGYLYDLMAWLYEEQGNLREAERHLELALRDREASQNRRLAGWGHSNYAGLLSRLGKYDQALTHAQAALATFEEIEDPLHLAYCHNITGVIYFRLRTDFDQAKAHYHKAIALGIALCNQRHLASVYNNMGKLFDRQRAYHKALEWYDKALRIHAPAPRAHFDHHINALANWSETLRHLGDYEGALHPIATAQELLKQAEPDSFLKLRETIRKSRAVTVWHIARAHRVR